MIRKNQGITRYIETIVYGIAGMTFMVAFFFGIMYPELSPAQGIYRMEECDSYQISDFEEPFCSYMLTQMKQRVDEENVVYTSYFYECLKKKENRK